MTTRTAAGALEKLIRLERDLEKKCHDLGYYNMIHVGLREFVEHADTLRTALAPPQEGEVEELARRFEAYADDADQHALFMVPIGAETLRHAARLLRATQSNGRLPENPATGRLQHRPNVARSTGSESGSAGCDATGGQIDGELPATIHALERAARYVGRLDPTLEGNESADGDAERLLELVERLRQSPAQSAPAQEPVAWQIKVAGVWAAVPHEPEWEPGIEARPLYAAPQPAPAQEPRAWEHWSLTEPCYLQGIYPKKRLSFHHVPLYAAPQPAPAQEHVAWLRYVRAHERPTRIQLCDSDTPGAFKVYAAPPPDEARELLRDIDQDLLRCLNVGEPPARVALLRAALVSDRERIRAFLASK